MNSSILITEPSKDYELLDSGEGEKLERFGNVVLSRPDPQALWHKKLDENEWKKAEAHFTRDGSDGRWAMKNPAIKMDKWQIDFGGLKLWIKPSAFKHVGVFPEQASNWGWLREMINNQLPITNNQKQISDKIGINILNLFGYTGGATLACAQAGANVVHVDSSKTAMTGARENAELSGLKDKPVRWILDDAREFVRRELKRGNKYDGIIMDPPAFGHGTDNELWKIEEHFSPLVEQCMELLKDKPLFFLINGYSAGYSAIAYQNILLPLVAKFGGKIEIGELAIQETVNRKQNIGENVQGSMSNDQLKPQNPLSRLLPAGIFARWSA